MVRDNTTQISDILENKGEMLCAYVSNTCTSKESKMSKYRDVNESLYYWYSMACSKNITHVGHSWLPRQNILQLD